MAVVMVFLSFALVPRYGILGAALAAALVNGVTNLWLLLDVRRKLKLYPYNLAYLRLFLPWAITALVVVEWRSIAPNSSPQYLVVLLALLLAYLVSLSIVALFALDPFDRQIIREVLCRLRNVLSSKPKATKNYSQVSI